MIIGVVSGAFDPLHVGHVRMLNEAKVRCDRVVVLLNSDKWLEAREKMFYVPFENRREILQGLRAVDEVRAVVDSDGSVQRGLWDLVFTEQEKQGHGLVFINGGARLPSQTPEVQYCQEHGIQLLWGVGGGADVRE